MNKKLVKFIDNSDMDDNIKDFLKESLAIGDEKGRRNKKKYEKLVDKYAGVDK